MVFNIGHFQKRAAVENKRAERAPVALLRHLHHVALQGAATVVRQSLGELRQPIIVPAE
jgi:hypothetical protein